MLSIVILSFQQNRKLTVGSFCMKQKSKAKKKRKIKKLINLRGMLKYQGIKIRRYVFGYETSMREWVDQEKTKTYGKASLEISDQGLKMRTDRFF